MNVSFYCRHSKARKNGEAPIEAVLTLNYQRTTISLTRYCNPDLFSKESNRRKGELVDYLSAVRTKLNEIETTLIREDKPLTPLNFKAYFLGGGKDYRENTREKCDWICDFLDRSIRLVANQCSTNRGTGTYKKYLLVLEDFKTWAEGSGYSLEIPCNEFTPQLAESFQTYLLNHYKPTTVSGKMTKFRCLMNKRQWLVPPFSTLKPVRRTVDIQFLTEKEIERIREKDFLNRRLNNVRDLFIFQCGSGLAYCDMASLTEDDVVDGMIQKHRQKTEELFTTVLLPDASAIWQKYGGHLPVLSNQKYNSYLKEIQDLCHISKPLHTHIARHSFATRLLNRGVRLETVSRCLGHSSVKMTQHYAKLVSSTVVNEVRDKFW